MRTKLLIIFLSCLCVSCMKQTKIIDYPEVVRKSTVNMEVYRVELTDTATILYTELYNRPDYWNRISSESYLEGLTTGKRYKLICSTDFELDKEVYMPKSGNHPATLLFEPVDPTEKAISFIEGPAEDAYRIEGIQLTKQKMKPGEFSCVLEGEVTDRPESSRLILVRKDKDLRINPFISIPIRDGKFSYTLYADVNESYELTFWDEYSNGSWRSVSFIAEPGTLCFTLYPMEHLPHFEIQTTAPLNVEAVRFSRELDSLFSYQPLTEERELLEREKRFYSPEMYALREKIEAATTNEARQKLYPQYDRLRESGKEYSPEGKALDDKSSQLSKDRQAWQLDYVKNQVTLNGYILYKEQLEQFLVALKYDYAPKVATLEVYEEIFSAYKEKFPSHPYTEELSRVLASLGVKVGGSYIDFTAPDLEGKPVKLSDQIKGKIALIDLWASWCGPCRRTSASMIPVYEAYKEKGFTIVGVARERGNTRAMKNAIEKDGYPWLNLVELDDAGNIWSTYGVSNGGGGTFLVDTDGTILAVHPSAAEVTKILAEKLP